MEKREEGDERECKREAEGRGEIKWRKERREMRENFFLLFVSTT